MKQIDYITTIVTELKQIGSDVLIVSLADPDQWELPPFEPGAYISLYLENGLTRCYSLCNNNEDRYHYQLAIKYSPQGEGGSAWLFENLALGKELHVSLPNNTMALQPGFTQSILIAGGIGITPIRAMAYKLEAQGHPYELHYFYGTDSSLLPFVEQPILEQTEPSGRLFLHDRNRSPSTSLHDVIPDYSPNICLYCCGPQKMLDEFTSIMQGWGKAQCIQEDFSAVELDGSMFTPFTIELAHSGRKIEVKKGQSPLKAVLEAGINIDHSCEGGICGSCKVRWCEGKPIHRDKVLNDKERQTEVILCVAGCASETLVLDL